MVARHSFLPLGCAFGQVSPSLAFSLLAVVLAAGSIYLSLAPSYGLPTPADNRLVAHTNPLPVDTRPEPRVPANPSVARSFSTLIADIAENVAPSVVNIDVARRVSAQELPGGGPGGFGMMPPDLFRFFFGSPFEGPGGNGVPRGENQQLGNGSGVIFDTQGHILTNYHVVGDADTIQVTLHKGQKLPAKLVGADPLTDLALLKLELNPTKGPKPVLHPARFGQSRQLRPGDWVIAVGSPLGFDHTVTLGIVSALSRQVPDINSNVDFIQTDAAINPGNSGGPLVNLSGEVVGINTAISGRAQNIGFAIPADTVRTVAQDLAEHGKVNRPMLGISMSDLTPELAAGLGLPEETKGVVVGAVLPQSPAERAGFQQGDIIQRINGKPVTEARQVQEWVRQSPIGTTFNMQIVREGNLRGLKITSQALSPEALEAALPRR